MYALEVQRPNDALAERPTGETGNPMSPFAGPTRGATVARGEAPATAQRHDRLRPGRSGRSEAREAETTKRQKPWTRALAGAVVGAAVLGTWAPANAYIPSANTQAAFAPPAQASEALSWGAAIQPPASWSAAARSAAMATASPPARASAAQRPAARRAAMASPRASRAAVARWAATVSFVNAAPLRAAVLANMRGGFVLPNGMNLDFGAVIETVRNGVTLLRTRVNFVNPAKAIVETLRDGVTTSTSVGAGQGIETSAGSEDSTFVIHQVTPTNIGAIVNNVTSNTDIVNTTQFNITISNFSQITNNLRAITLNRLSNITSGAVQSGLGM